MKKEKGTERSRRIGAHLKKLRVERNLSQEAASEIFDVEPRTWRRYEEGEYLPPTEQLLRLHEEWDADITWLLFDTSFQYYDKKVLRTPPRSKK